MTPRERDTLETILRDVAGFNERHISKVCIEPIQILIAPGVVSFNTDVVIRSVQMLPTGARCA